MKPLFTDFAPNEFFIDFVASVKVFLNPVTWFDGPEKSKLQNEMISLGKSFTTNLYFDFFFNGRTALKNLLLALNFPKNSEVIIQAFTCEAVPVPIIAAGCLPIYCDIEMNSYSMNPDYLKKLVNQNTRAIIIQHTFGLIPQYREEIINFAKQNNLVIIEDLSHSTIYKELFLNLNLVDCKNHFLLVSFGRSKAISSVFGGGIFGDKDFIIQASQNNNENIGFIFLIKLLIYKPISYFIKKIYNLNYYLGFALHKALNIFGLLVFEITSREKKGDYEINYDIKYPNALAKLLLVQWRNIQNTIHLKVANTHLCLDLISNCDTKIYYKNLLDKGIILLRLPLRVKNLIELNKILKDKHIYLGSWYNQVVAPKGTDLIKVGYQIGSCPQAESVCREIINIPLSIKTQEIKKLINLIKNYGKY